MSVYDEIVAERAQQDAKWGEQNHPDVRRALMNREGGCSPRQMAKEYEIPTAYRAKATTDAWARHGQVTWTDIALEELCEAVEAATLGGTAELRSELVQTAAVLVQWIEAIDRRATSCD